MKRILGIILGTMMCVGAFYCIANPVAAFSTLSICLAFTMIESAIGYFMLWLEIKKQGGKDGLLIVNAIISLIAGIILCTDLFTQIIVDGIMLNIIAFYMIFNGILTIVVAFKIKNIKTGSHWIAILILGILMTIAGVISFINPIVLAISLGFRLGFNILTVGASLIFISIIYKEDNQE